MKYEIIVVGGGHAGIEAALAGARTGHKTLLVTGNLKNVGDMPCNPAIGGSAKGIVVREIDALGGEMGKQADQCQIQIKMLNTKKGPAVRALRAQVDKVTYPQAMLKVLEEQENLDLKEAIVDDLILKDQTVTGIVLNTQEKIDGQIVILTTGTYLRSVILRGATKEESGPHGEKSAPNLSVHLKEYGFDIQRLKTGTPPRIEKSTIDYSKAQIEKGDDVYRTFSYETEPTYQIEEQVPCHLIYTTPVTHQLINDNLEKSSMYGGYVEGIGPRYCPSIEDKVVRFKDKPRHQLFLEPESKYYDDIYIQGFSTSMPEEIQEQMVHSLTGLEQAKINKYAYAIEYDAINPLQMWPSLESKIIENLFTAGQINGTSGYEEAAAQGLIAGINAHQKLKGGEPFILKRNEAYIGVLIDDLVTKGTKEPYRLLTSRAEYRLLLRHDNADLRLTEYGYQYGLIKEERYKKFCEKRNQIDQLLTELETLKIQPTEQMNAILKKHGSNTVTGSIKAIELLKRPYINLSDIQPLINLTYPADVFEQVDIKVKYEGYIAKAQREVEKMLKYEDKRIPDTINYDEIHNLASEAKQKLKQVQPKSIGQAMRISGVNPADISILMIHLKKESA